MRDEVRDEVELILKEGGEIPEVAFWNSYFYLTKEPPEGLGFELKPEELRALKEAVIERYMTIIERDLTAENIDKSLYRGPERAEVNFKRLKSFLEREGFRVEPYRQRVVVLAERFLKEVSDERLREKARRLLRLLKNEKT